MIKNVKSEKGVTLIILTTTLIIMILLMSVTLYATLDTNGVVYKAKEAKFKSNMTIISEKVQAYVKEKRLNEDFDLSQINAEYESEDLKNIVPDIVSPFTHYCKIYYGELYYCPRYEATKTTQNEVQWCKEIGIKIWGQDEAQPGYIPDGFSYKEGSISQGYVITDDISGGNNGNEYVWVPVYNKVKRSDWIDSISEGFTNVGLTQDDAEAFISSVEKYNGFYVARYEAGIPQESGMNFTTANKNVSGVPVSKKYQIPWTGISYQAAKTNAQSVLDSDDNVQSGITNSYAWDLIMQWLSNTGHIVKHTPSINGNFLDRAFNANLGTLKTYATINDSTSLTSVTADSLAKTTGQKVLLLTGSYEDSKMNNIYDLAGNVNEMTTESLKDNSKVHILRGCSGLDNSADVTIGQRKVQDVEAGDPVLSQVTGFRVILYKSISKEAAQAEATVRKISDLFDSTGTLDNKVHVGDYIDYKAGAWTDENVNNIYSGDLKGRLTTANNSLLLPYGVSIFGGFNSQIADGRDGNATSFNSTFSSNYKGWRVFDIKDDGSVVLISAGNPEDFCYKSDDKMGYVAEYMLTGDANPSSSFSEENMASNFIKRDWNLYLNNVKGAKSARAIKKSDLNSWYSKYISANADVTNSTTFQKIYNTRYQTLIDNNSYYYLAEADSSTGSNIYAVNPSSRNVQTVSDEGYGVRVLVTLAPETEVYTLCDKTDIYTPSNVCYTYNLWKIKDGDSVNVPPDTINETVTKKFGDLTSNNIGLRNYNYIIQDKKAEFHVDFVDNYNGKYVLGRVDQVINNNDSYGTNLSNIPNFDVQVHYYAILNCIPDIYKAGNSLMNREFKGKTSEFKVLKYDMSGYGMDSIAEGLYGLTYVIANYNVVYNSTQTFFKITSEQATKEQMNTPGLTSYDDSSMQLYQK